MTYNLSPETFSLMVGQMVRDANPDQTIEPENADELRRMVVRELIDDIGQKISSNTFTPKQILQFADTDRLLVDIQRAKYHEHTSMVCDVELYFSFGGMCPIKISLQTGWGNRKDRVPVPPYPFLYVHGTKPLFVSVNAVRDGSGGHRPYWDDRTHHYTRFPLHEFDNALILAYQEYGKYQKNIKMIALQNERSNI